MDQRMEFALQALVHPNFRELCREYGISAKTGYKWRERFVRHGLSGLNDLSRRPPRARGRAWGSGGL
jgi:putative transposase